MIKNAKIICKPYNRYSSNTDDLDMWLEDTSENRINLRQAFNASEYGDYASIETMQFVPGWTTFYAAGVQLDIMNRNEGT